VAEEQAEQKPAAANEKAKPPKKEKPPKPEDKPFSEFITQEFIPALKTDWAARGIDDLELSFIKESIPVPGVGGGLCRQVIGHWQGGDREFRVYFPKEDISGIKGFSYTEKGAVPATLESFLIDERRITLALLVSGVALRVQAQKWIGHN
jgi:hypothetical protein